MISPGALLAGKYRVDGILGEGGFGIVLAATHLHLGERVAMKILRTEIARDRGIVARFLREAQSAAKLKSNHVARVLDVGTLHDGSPYIIMEYLDGEDLASVLQRRQAVSAMDACSWVLDACEAIAEAHALGIVHRDLKPANLFLARGPGRTTVVKVLDFGISKAASAANGMLTATSTILGSPVYASPEQLRSTRDADPRSDVWSLGATLYHLVSGRVPFPGETLTEVCMRVAVDAVPPLPRDLGVPRALEAAIRTCLTKDPGQRFRDIPGLATALAPFAGETAATSLRRVHEAAGTALSATPRPGRHGSGAVVASTISVSAGELRGNGAGLGHRRARVAALVAIAALAVGLATAGASKDDRPADQAAASRDNAPPVPPIPPPTTRVDAGTQAREEPVEVADPPARQMEPVQASAADAGPDASGSPEGTEARAPEPAAEVELRIVVVPRNATIVLDGEVARANPLRLTRSAADVHHMVVSAPGYETQSRRVRASESGDLRIELLKTRATSQRGRAVKPCPASDPLCSSD